MFALCLSECYAFHGKFWQKTLKSLQDPSIYYALSFLMQDLSDEACIIMQDLSDGACIIMQDLSDEACIINQ